MVLTVTAESDWTPGSTVFRRRRSATKIMVGIGVFLDAENYLEKKEKYLKKLENLRLLIR